MDLCCTRARLVSFFFSSRRRHTRCSRDWSSDVCSSDLGPFTLGEARAAGVTRTSLRGKSWRRLGSGLYCWIGLQDDPWRLLCAWASLLPRQAVFAGPTAAWLHGLDADPVYPVEVIVPQGSGVRSRAGLTVRHSDVVRDVVTLRGLKATGVHRTL